jgi:Flp pilus assembly CpaF family ATPase
VEPNQHQRVKLQLAVIAASAIVSVAALLVALGQERTSTVMGGGMSTGQTSTQTTLPTTLTTSVVSPTMTAVRPKGF